MTGELLFQILLFKSKPSARFAFLGSKIHYFRITEFVKLMTSS